MFKFSFKIFIKKIISDSITPVSLYLKLRDHFPHTLLLESYDYKLKQNDCSIICINPVSEFIINKNKIQILRPNKIIENFIFDKKLEIHILIDNFLKSFNPQNPQNNDNLLYSGLYGYIGYNAIKLFEKIKFKNINNIKNYNIPDIRLGFYSNIIVFHHFYNEISIIEHRFDNSISIEINKIINLINNKNLSFFKFNTIDNITSNINDEEHINMINQGINYCFRGDIFQIVLSRKFQQKFIGDEFNVYRALRIINPSPYLFYFDYGHYKLFGSSPESQVIINNNIAYINPIAGTIKRSKNNDKKLSQILIKDSKENSEHVMLVDLARNDLSKNAYNVKVEEFKTIQMFSHVLHMVSKVSGTIYDKISSIKVLIDTFPAGTLSGAPKYKAMELINIIEKENRDIYGGTIGFFGLNNNINTAIIIRTFISINNILYFQAGSGIVSKSIAIKELQEVKNKLQALFQAIEKAKNI